MLFSRSIKYNKVSKWIFKKENTRMLSLYFIILDFVIIFNLFNLKYKFLVINIDSTLIQQIGLALITFFLPFWIVFIQQQDEKKSLSKLDQIILFNEIVNYKKILIYFFSFILFPVLLGTIYCINNIFKDYLLFFIFSSFIFSFINLVKIILLFFKWTNFERRKNNIKFIDEKRLEFVKKNTDDDLLEDIWESIWNSEKTPLLESQFFDIYISKLNYFIDVYIKSIAKDKFKIAGNVESLLNIFYIHGINEKKIDIIFLYDGLIFEFLKILRKIYSKNNRDHEYYKIMNYLVRIINKIRDFYLLEDNNMEYLLINSFKSFFDEIKDKKEEISLLEYVFSSILNYDFFTMVGKSMSFWEFFAWKIKDYNDLKEDNIKILFFNNYISFIRDRILKNSKDIDLLAERISVGLFPSFDQEAWCLILYLVALHPNKLNLIISYNLVFGFTKIYTGFVDVDETIEEAANKFFNKKTDYTLDSAIKIFYKIFTIQYINEKMKELNLLKETELDDKKNERLLQYEDVLNKLNKKIQYL